MADSPRRTLWERMRSYRLWKANRDVFLYPENLYPENYVEPELRDDKTAVFEDLEKNVSDASGGESSAERHRRPRLRP